MDWADHRPRGCRAWLDRRVQAQRNASGSVRRLARLAAPGVVAATVLAATVLAATVPAATVPAATVPAATVPAATGLAATVPAAARLSPGSATALERTAKPSGPAGLPFPPAPAVRVLAGELVSTGTGSLLWSQHADARRPMGSITKVMTALVVLTAGDLGGRVRVTRAAVAYVSKDDASSAGLIADDQLTARQLLAAMLIPSGCDAAYLLATSYGPGRAAFIVRMNAIAAALGSPRRTSPALTACRTRQSTRPTPALAT